MKILILSHTRCGSTTLCKWLSKELNFELDEMPYNKITFNSVFEKQNIIRKIVVEEYFPTKEEIDRFDKVIFLTRNNNIDAAISYIIANDLVEWHKEYEITSEWIEKNNIKIINISNYINSLKIKLNDYIGFHVTYEDIYVNKSSVFKILDYMGITSLNHLDMLEYEKKYRKDKNVFIKKYNGAYMILQQKILFNRKECESIISHNDTHITNWRMGDRKYNSQPINYSLETKWLFDKLKDFVERETNIEIRTIKKTIHFHKFTKGDWFGKHNDVRDNRLYAVGVLLNDDFEGGDFNLYNPNEIVLNRVIGNTYLFDVRIDHEITPILKGERYSLLWFLENEHIKIEKNKLI